MVYRITQNSSTFNIQMPVDINVFAAPNMAILLAPGETINLGHGILVRNDRAHAVSVCLSHTPNQEEGQWHVVVVHGLQSVSYLADNYLDNHPPALFKVVADAADQEEIDVEIDE